MGGGVAGEMGGSGVKVEVIFRNNGGNTGEAAGSFWGDGWEDQIQ
jgi:hypothetical protein